MQDIEGTGYSSESVTIQTLHHDRKRAEQGVQGDGRMAVNHIKKSNTVTACQSGDSV